MRNPTESRERLCRFVYKTVEPTNPLGLLQEALVLSQTAEPIEKRIRVEGVKTGKVTALDLPGQIQQALAAGIISETEAARAARLRPQGDGPHQRRRLRAERAGRAGAAGTADAGRRFQRSRRLTRTCRDRSILAGDAAQTATLPFAVRTASACGQRAETHIHSIRGVRAGGVRRHHACGFARVAHALARCFSKPGFLTAEYSRGRRARYLPPFRLYLVLSVVFFLVACSAAALQRSCVDVNLRRRSASRRRGDNAGRRRKLRSSEQPHLR